MLLPTYISTISRMINQQQQNLIAIFFSPLNPDVHVSMKIKTFIISKGSWGYPHRSRINFKKSNKKEAFPLFFSAFWQGSLYPQNDELAPQHP